MRVEWLSASTDIRDPRHQRRDHSQSVHGKRYEDRNERVADCHRDRLAIPVEMHEKRYVHTKMEEGVRQRSVRDPRGVLQDPDSAEWETLESPHLSGEMFRTVLGHLQGVYTWECDHFPSEEEIREGMCVRVVRDCSRFGRRDRCTELSGWHGGWTREGIGIFTTDVRSTSLGNRTRRLGRATVMVRTPRNSGSRTWNGIVC